MSSSSKNNSKSPSLCHTSRKSGNQIGLPRSILALWSSPCPLYLNSSHQRDKLGLQDKGRGRQSLPRPSVYHPWLSVVMERSRMGPIPLPRQTPFRPLLPPRRTTKRFLQSFTHIRIIPVIPLIRSWSLPRYPREATLVSQPVNQGRPVRRGVRRIFHRSLRPFAPCIRSEIRALPAWNPALDGKRRVAGIRWMSMSRPRGTAGRGLIRMRRLRLLRPWRHRQDDP